MIERPGAVQIVDISRWAVSLSLSCYRQARYWLERYPLRFNLFLQVLEKRRAGMRSCHSHNTICGSFGSPQPSASGAL